MELASVQSTALSDRRQSRRVKLAVPVQFRRASDETAQGVYQDTGWSADISSTGLYLTTGAVGDFASGAILKVSVVIPWELRRTFPFSRVAGWCRVARVEEVPAVHGARTGVGLAFCENQITLLGAIVTP